MLPPTQLPPETTTNVFHGSPIIVIGLIIIITRNKSNASFEALHCNTGKTYYTLPQENTLP